MSLAVSVRMAWRDPSNRATQTHRGTGTNDRKDNAWIFKKKMAENFRAGYGGINSTATQWVDALHLLLSVAQGL